MSYAEIVLKSGAVVRFEAEELSWTRTTLGNSIRWATPEGWERKLVHVDIEEIAAVLYVDER